MAGFQLTLYGRIWVTTKVLFERRTKYQSGKGDRKSVV
jgi:hypothetical protein